MAPARRTTSVILGVLLILPAQVLSFATVPSLARKGRHQQRFLQGDVITPRIPTLPNKAAARHESAMKAGFATARGGDSGCQTLTLTSTLTHRGRGPSWRWSRSGSSRLRVLGGGGGCDSEEECEIIYDDDEDVAATAATATTEDVEKAPAATSTTSSSTEAEVEVEQDEGGEGQTAGGERAELDHREKVLDDGFQKQGMLKWREAKVLDNSPASADERSRLLTLALVGGDGLEFEFSRAAWLDNYKVPGQFVGVRLDNGGDGGVAGCLVAVTMEPTSVRQSDGKIQVLVTEEATFRLKGDTRGPAEEAKGRSLAALEEGEKVKLSDFMGRGFSSLFVGWIGLQSALQEKRDIVIVASGARGLGSIKPVLDWPPVQAHAGIKQVSVYLEDESPVSAAFLNDFLAWRSSGIRVTQCFTSKTPGTPSNVEAAIFAGGEGLRAAVGGDPGAASFLIAGLPGKRAMELTDQLTDQGVDASRLLFNEFF